MSEFLLKPRICFGQDALSVLNELSARSVLLVTDQAMVKFGLAERVTALLRQRGIAWQMWDDVVADPDIATVVRGMKLMDNHYPDLVIALGGGSVIDAAKAVIFSWRKPVRRLTGRVHALSPSPPPAAPVRKSPPFRW